MNKGKNLFFGEKDLLGYSYVFYLPNSTFDEKILLSSRIRSLGGV
jgi:hypothetical protein